MPLVDPRKHLLLCLGTDQLEAPDGLALSLTLGLDPAPAPDGMSVYSLP
jgi:hypothetical protein